MTTGPINATPIPRRRALRLLGLGTAAAALGLPDLLYGDAGIAGATSPRGRTASTGARVASRQGGTAPPQARAVIRTLLGDLTPDEIGDGAILFHEHLSFKWPQGAETHVTDDVDLIIEEVRIAMDEGIAAMVDAGHPDMHRNLGALRRIAQETGMPVVASGGWYMQNHYPPRISRMSAEELADELVAEAERDDLGALGEIGQEEGVLTEDERKVFRAVGLAHARTGLPVFTHNAYSIRNPDVPREAGLRQLDILEEAGADPGSVCIGHVCCLDDPNAEVASEIARRGAHVGFDRVGIDVLMPDEQRVEMAMALVEAGHADRLLLSADFYSGASLKSNDGPGLARPATEFGPRLLDAGMSEETLDQVLVENPRRFLSFVPRG